MTGLRPLSAVFSEERDWLTGFIADQPILSLYFEATLEDLSRGVDNRLVLIGRQRRGFILGFAFDTSDVFTAFGDLAEDELKTVSNRPGRAEICGGSEIVDRVRRHCCARFDGIFGMRVYRCETMRYPSIDQGCRRLTIADLPAAAAFYAAHYPQTVFSAWMLNLPFLARFEGNQIIAAAGALAVSRKHRWSIIGNFLTDPAWRGKGLAKALGRTLLSALKSDGIDHAALVTTDENQAAWGVYESLGFRLAERWVQLDLKSTN